jgi:hypothetical protein
MNLEFKPKSHQKKKKKANHAVSSRQKPFRKSIVAGGLSEGLKITILITGVFTTGPIF